MQSEAEIFRKCMHAFAEIRRDQFAMLMNQVISAVLEKTDGVRTGHMPSSQLNLYDSGKGHAAVYLTSSVTQKLNTNKEIVWSVNMHVTHENFLIIGCVEIWDGEQDIATDLLKIEDAANSVDEAVAIMFRFADEVCQFPVPAYH